MKNAKLMAATVMTISVTGLITNVPLMEIAQYCGIAVVSQGFIWVNQ